MTGDTSPVTFYWPDVACIMDDGTVAIKATGYDEEGAHWTGERRWDQILQITLFGFGSSKRDNGTKERSSQIKTCLLFAQNMKAAQSNQSMKPTAPLRVNFSVLATNPARGLSLSR
jgi:hypothetical protein